MFNRLLPPVALTFLVTSGCASIAVRPPSPAAQLRPQDLGPSSPEVSYYVMVFASQSCPKVPRLTHTWATVVKVVDQGPGRPPAIEQHTISWMPASLQIRPWRCWVEAGVNLSLEHSLCWAVEEGQRVSLWGPYQLRPEVYSKFLIQKAFLESGQVGYQCVDTIGEAAWNGSGSNCIHAISDIDADHDRGHYPVRRHGDAASEYLVKQLFEGGLLIGPPHTQDWLISALGVDRYPIVHRHYEGQAVPASASPCERPTHDWLPP
jgi:hypothetical protein